MDWFATLTMTNLKIKTPIKINCIQYLTKFQTLFEFLIVFFVHRSSRDLELYTFLNIKDWTIPSVIDRVKNNPNSKLSERRGVRVNGDR